MTGMPIDLPGLRCWVEAPDAVLTDTGTYLAPAQCSYSATPISADARIVGRIDDDAVRAAFAVPGLHTTVWSHPELAYRCADRVDGRTLIPAHGPRHVIQVSGEAPQLCVRVAALEVPVLVRVVRRVVRALALRGVEAAGGACVHAGAVRLGTGGLLVGGAPGCGKTSVLTELIETHGAQPVSNDRTAILTDTSGCWMGHGIPLAWRYAPPGLAASPLLAAAARQGTLRRGGGLVDGKVEFTLGEIGKHLHSEPLPATKLTRVLLLHRGSDPAVNPLTPEFAARHLSLDPEPFADDWLDLRRRIGALVTAGVPQQLLRAVDTTILRWQEPVELAGLARRLAKEAWS